MTGQQGIADEGGHIDHGVHDDRWPQPPGAVVQPTQQQPEDKVGHETAETLIQMIGAPDPGARNQDGPQMPTGLPPPGEQIADHDGLFKETVYEGRQQIHGDGPPGIAQPGHLDGGVETQLVVIFI